MAAVLLTAPAAFAAPGAQLWLQPYGGSGPDFAHALAVNPTGSRVFVTGQGSCGGDYCYLTVAHKASTGSPIWAKRLHGSGQGYGAFDVAVSADGSVVFVTGEDHNNGNVVTVAYKASTGNKLWQEGLTADAGLPDPPSVAVSPNGSRVFVAGTSYGGSNSGENYSTVAYRASTGNKLWLRHYAGPGDPGLNDDYANALGVSPDGTTVFVTGESESSAVGGPSDYATLAYSASTGKRLWVTRYDGPSNLVDNPSAIGVSPDGATVFVTGEANYALGSGLCDAPVSDYATVAYDASTGAQQWATLYHGSSTNEARALGVSPDGLEVFVTGVSGYNSGCTAHFSYATVAYDASTGTQAWETDYGNGGANNANTLDVSPDGADVFVGGSSDLRHGTVAYNASTGAQEWANSKHYNGAEDLQVSPTGSSVFVTGGHEGTVNPATVAFSTG